VKNDLNWLNQLTLSEAAGELLKCCGSQRWVNEIAARRPFATLSELNQTASDVWWSLDRNDWLEAFRSHPKIGERKAQTEGTTQSQKWSEQEQSGVAASGDSVKEELARLNHEYEEKFGYIFIVCATGKSSEEMLAILRSRLENSPPDELPIAAAEQAKITELRLTKLLTL
jgi:OHCU decarboxylase